MGTPPRTPADRRFAAGFAAIRAELELPDEFPTEVRLRAQQVAEGATVDTPRATDQVLDLRDIAFVTIDPPSSLDLDQAYAAERAGSGYRVRYAIADVAGFVAPDDPVDAEARRRGVTLYGPDRRLSLHPTALSEGVASLLPDVDRPAVVWTIDLDQRGELAGARLERARVRSRAKLSYAAVQTAVDEGTADPALHLLREIGELRAERELERGGVSLNLPSQEVVATDDGYALRYDTEVPAENWNAQISLLTGIAAAGLMLDAGVGVLRTLPDPDQATLDDIRRRSLALGVPWPDGATYAEVVGHLDPANADHAALLSEAVRALRGAGYVAFDGERPEQRRHWAVAASYAHVTAPLRRLGDRFVNEVVLAITAGVRPPGWALDALPDLPDILQRGRRRAGSLDRAVVDFVEAMVLEHCVGETYEAVAIRRRRGDELAIQLRHPAVAATVDAPGVEPGDEIAVRVAEAVPEERRVRFELV